MLVPAPAWLDTSRAPGLPAPPASCSAVSLPPAIQTGLPRPRREDGTLRVAKPGPWLASPPSEAGLVGDIHRDSPHVTNLSPGSTWSLGRTTPPPGFPKPRRWPGLRAASAPGQAGAPSTAGPSGPGRAVQPVGHRLTLSASWNSGTWRGPFPRRCAVRDACARQRPSTRPTGGWPQCFVFVFNQDYFFLFSYKFASCKQVHKDPSFGEIRVRVNTSARRRIYFKMLWCRQL